MEKKKMEKNGNGNFSSQMRIYKGVLLNKHKVEV